MTALGIDYGTVRIGVARQIPNTQLVVPLATIAPNQFDNQLQQWLEDFQITEVYVGLPVSLSGHESESAQRVRDWFEKTKNQFPDLEWQLIDERLTSVVAGNSLQQLGKTSKEQRKVVDEFAAVLILEQALATREKSS